MRKTNSTNYQNQISLQYRCPLSQVLDIISGRWKPVILWRLMSSKRTFGQLKAALPEVSERMLAKQLRELVADGLVAKVTLSLTPPRAEYHLSELGLSLKPQLKDLSDWGQKYKVLRAGSS
jgi:DNA-binding HxlR family transcriptional regulator